MSQAGLIYVTRYHDGKEASFPGFTKVRPLTKSSKNFHLSPYYLRTEEGYLLENYWHACKVYRTVPTIKQRYSQWDKRVIWKHPKETHVDADGNILPAYFAWKQKLCQNPDPVRYPVGYTHRHECLGAFEGAPRHVSELLGYIAARKQIYGQIYVTAVRKEPMFWDLVKRHANGENLLICEPDGMYQADLPYFQERYNVPADWIFDDTVIIDEDNLEIIINDPKRPCGHSFFLAREIMRAATEL